MERKRDQELIKRIAEHYGRVIDLDRAPGVMIEILREYGPNIRQILDDDGGGGGGGAPGVSSIAIAGPGSGSVTLEDLMRLILDLRQQIIKLSERGIAGR